MRRYTWWSSHAPATPAPPHPALGRLFAAGEGPEGPAWLEARPAGRLLCDLSDPLPPEVLASVVGQIAHALAALHRRELGHGHVGAHRILLAASGDAVVLLGAPSPVATPAGDLHRLRQLWTPEAEAALPWPVDAGAEAIGTLLSTWARDRGAVRIADLVSLQPQPLPGSPEVLELHVHAASGGHDEVAPDLGPDVVERGLLDPWTAPGQGADTTGERTGAIEPRTDGASNLMAALADLAGGAGLTEHHEVLQALGPRPATSVKACIADDPMDLLPAPDALAQRLQALQGLDERSVEITAVRLHPVASEAPAQELREVTEVSPERTLTHTHGGPAEGLPTARGVALMTIGAAVGLVVAVAILLALGLQGP